MVAQLLLRHPEAGVERTIGGYAKEALKAIPRGLVQGLEQATTGAAALLPEDFEKPVVAKARELAERFSPTAGLGYEEAIPTKLGEGLGSMGTFLIPGGLPARTAMAGAMGAGEARQRAQKAGATPEEISSATAQGILPGLTDILPVERLINGLGKTAINGITTRLVRMAETGGMEGAQEMAQNIGQNIIAQGYDPTQGTFTGTGEAGAYGAGVGAVAQGLLDLAFGRRAPRIAGTKQAQGDGSIEAIPQEPIVPVGPVAKEPTPVAPAPDTTAAAVPVGPADPATQAQIDVKQAELDKRTAEIADMQSRFKSLSPGDRAYLKNKRKSNAKLTAEIEALKAAAPVTQPVTPQPKAAAPAAAPLKIVRPNEPVVAPAIDPATLLSQPYTPTGTRTVLRDGEPVQIYDKEKPITDPDTGVLVQKTIYKGKEAYTPITELSEVPNANANPDKAKLSAPATTGSNGLAKSDGVPVSPTSTGGSSASNAGGLGVGANQQPAGKLDAGKGAQQGTLKEEPYTSIKPSGGMDFAKYSFKDENGVHYNVSYDGDVHVTLPDNLMGKFDNQKTIVFRNGDPRRNVYPADKLPLFVPPTIKDAIYSHVNGKGLNGEGVKNIKKAVDATYAKRKGAQQGAAAQDVLKGKVTKDSEGMWHYDDADETAKGVGGEYGTTFKDPSKHLGISSVYIARNKINLYGPNKTRIDILFKDHKTIVYVEPNYDTDGAVSVGFFENIKSIKNDPNYHGLDGMEEYGIPPKLAEAIRKTAAQITKDANSGKELAIFDTYAIPFLYDTLGAKGLREIKKANSINSINYQIKSGYSPESITEATNIHKETFGESIEPSFGMKATVVKPTAEEAAKQAAAEAEKQKQLAATPKRVIKKSEAGQAAAAAKEAKRLAKKAAEGKAGAAEFQAQIDAANPEPETAAEKVSNESDITKSVKALEAATTSKEGIEQFRNHLDFLTSDPTGKAQKRIPNWVTEEQIAASIRRNDYLAGRGNVRGEVDLVVRIDKLTDTLSDIDSRFKNAVEDDDTALQTALTSRREAVEAELTDLKKSAKAQNIDLSAPRIDKRHIRTPRGSQGEPAEPTGNTRAAIVTSLKSAFKTSANFDALVTVVQEEGDLPPDVLNDPTYRAGTRGVAYEGKVYLVANNIPQGRELGVFLHEAGAHIGFDRVLSDDARRFLADKVRQWSKEGDVKGTAAKEALRKGGRVDDEVIAYMVEELVNAGVTPTSFKPESSWLRRVYAAFNKFLKNIGMRGEILPQDLVDAAYGAAHLEMNRGELTGLKFQTARALEAQKLPSEKITKFREAAGLEPTEKISRATTTEGMDEVQAVRDQEIGAPKENTRLTGYSQVTPAPRVNINTDNGNVEVIANGKVVHSVPFASPKLINAYKGDTRDRVIKETSEKITDSDEFQRALNKAHDAWMETQPYNSYEQRFLALIKAASGYAYGDKYINSILANSNGGTIYNIRPSMRNANESIQSAASGGRSQQQIIKDIEKVAPIGIGSTRFSVANPAILAGQSTADYLFRGPSAPRSLLDRAAETASGVRQNMANKLEWWMDKATRVYGNAATDATGEAALRDRIEAGSKVSHIALNKLLLGGLEKKNGFWQAVKTDASYQDMLNELEKAVGKYDGVNNFADINRLFDFAATARREQELIKAGKMAWQTPEGIQPTLDAATQARGVTPQMDEGMRIYNGVPEIKTALDIFERFNNRGVDAMVTAGVIDAPTAAGLKGNAGYVPWFRISQDKDGNIKIPAPRDYAKGLVNLSNMRDLEGAKIENFQINHVLDNMAQLSGWMTSKTIGNDTAAYMVDFATKFGVAGKPFAKKVGRAQANSVQVMQNGVPTYYAFDDPMAIPAFRGYESAHSAITEFLSAPANLVRMGVTAFPVFSISQLPQDAMRAFIESDLKNPYALIPRIMGNFVKELIGGGTASGKRLAQFGIVGRGGDIMPGEARRSIREKLGHYDSNTGGAAKKFWAGLERLQAASDAASRTALYELTLKETGNEALAIRKAREIINFDTQGASAYSTFLRQTVPFMGVSMIGLNNLYKGLVLGQRLSDKEASAAKRSIIYHGTQIAVLTMLYTMLVGDTDDYKKLSDSERNRNFIVPGTGLAIPVPGDGLGYLFKVIPEQIARYTLAEGLESKDMGSKAGRALWKGFTNLGSFESYIPVVGSPLPKTFVELVLNENWYTGNPIVGKSKEHLDPADQYTDTTSEIAKQLGKALNLSPLKLDYVVRAMSGQMGGFVMAMSEAAVNSAQGKVTPPWDIRSFPGLSAFTYPDGKDRAALEDFYELRGRVDTVARTYTDMANTGRGKEALAYLAEGDNKRAYALRQFQTQAERGLAQFRRTRTLIINDTSITDGAEMKRRLKELDDKENAYLKSMRLPDRREFAQLTPSFDPSILKAFR